MRKMVLILFVLFFCQVNNLSGANGTNIFHGYQKTKWGSSLKTVKSRYHNLKKIKSEIKKTTCYVQKSPSKTIAIRKFYFYKGELYTVFIGFAEGLQSGTKDTIYRNIIKKFGEPHETIEPDNLFWFFNKKTMSVYLKLSWIYPGNDNSNNSYTTYISYAYVESQKKLKKDQLEEETKNIDDF